MMNKITRETLLHEYFKQWTRLFKEGAVRPITLEKYRNNYVHLKNIVPDLALYQLDRTTYQQILNDYALTHERRQLLTFITSSRVRSWMLLMRVILTEIRPVKWFLRARHQELKK